MGVKEDLQLPAAGQGLLIPACGARHIQARANTLCGAVLSIRPAPT
jgi:hypothetical protein